MPSALARRRRRRVEPPRRFHPRRRANRILGSIVPPPPSATLSGTWVSPTLALSEDPIAGSIIFWSATVPAGATLTIQTSTDNGASWQTATNQGPVDRLPIGSTSVRALLVRVLLARTSTEVEAPRLHRLEVRVAMDSSIDEYCQVGHFVLVDSEVVDSSEGLVVRLTGVDLSVRVARNTWDESVVIEEGTNVRVASTTLLQNRYPDIRLNLASTERTTTRLFYGQNVGSGNPWTDNRNLWRDVGFDLFFDGYGLCTSRPVPDPDVMPSVWVFDDSTKPTIIDLSRRMTDENTYNKVIVTGESTSNDVPVTAFWVDDDPTSRTYYKGPYGVKTKTIRSDKIRDQDQAQGVADAEGLRVKGATEIVRISAIVTPFLDVSDVIEVDRERSKTIGRFAIDAMSIPLGPEELMTMTCRRQRQ